MSKASIFRRAEKRIGIARMMMRDAQVMIFDEPTAELNEEAAREVIAVLQFLSTKNMVIVTTHSKEVMAISQMHLRIEKGHISLKNQQNKP